MRRLAFLGVLFVLAFFVVAPTIVSAAGAHDISLWTRWDGEGMTPIPWYVYSGKSIAFDSRYNFDLPDTFAGFVGKPFGSDTFGVTPKVGFLAGAKHGASMQIDVFLVRAKVTIFTLNQYARMGGRTPDFAYHWGDALFEAKKGVAFGIDEEFYKEPRQDIFFDIGPVLKFSPSKLRGVYLRVWSSFDPGHNWSRKLYFVVGYAP